MDIIKLTSLFFILTLTSCTLFKKGKTSTNYFVDEEKTHFVCFNCDNIYDDTSILQIKRLDVEDKNHIISSELSNFKKLEELVIIGKNVSFDSDIKNILSLKVFNYWGNGLQEPPFGILNSENLEQVLLVLKNDESYKNVSYEALGNIKDLWISFDNLEEIPAQIFTYKNLEVLKITVENKIIGINSKIEKLTRLKKVFLPIRLDSNNFYFNSSDLLVIGVREILLDSTLIEKIKKVESLKEIHIEKIDKEDLKELKIKLPDIQIKQSPLL